MESFRGYFFSLFTVCILCMLCEMISGFTSKGVSSALKLVYSTVLLLTVFSAVFSGCDISVVTDSLSAATEITLTSEISYNSESVFLEKTKQELENNLSSAIYEKFGIKPDSVSIEFNTEANKKETEVSVHKISIVLPSYADNITISATDIFTQSLFGTDTQISTTRRS